MKTAALLLFIAVRLSGDCLPLHGEFIRASDLAAAVPVFGLAANQVIAPAPLAGAQRRYSAAELLRVARRLGLSAPPVEKLPDSVCLAYPAKPLVAEQVAAAVGKAIGPAGKFEVTEFSLFPVPAGEIVFPAADVGPRRRDGTTLLHGSVTYAPRRKVPVWARIRLLGKVRVLVAAQNLVAGGRLGPLHVQMAEADQPVASGLSSAAEIEGMMPRRAIAAGTPLARSMLVACRDVDPGQAVQVRVRSGAAHLTFESKAETGGYAGDRILLKNPASGQRFRGTVEGRSKVLVELPGKEQ